MYCSNCGRKIEGNECSYCGYVQSENNNNVNNVNKEKKIPTKLLVIIIGLVVLVLGGFIFATRKSVGEKFVDSLKNHDYDMAHNYYNSGLVGNEKEYSKAYNLVVEELNRLVEAYFSDTISYENVTTDLNAYSDFYYQEVNDALTKINKLKDSKNAFQLAEEEYISANYKEAYNYYIKVWEEDKNYTVAAEKKQESYDFIKEQIFALAEEKYNSGEYKEAIKKLNEGKLILVEEDQNKADEKIQEYEAKIISEISEEIDKYLDENDFTSCFGLITDLKGYDNAEVDSIIENINSKYETYIENEISTLLAERQYEESMGIVNEALKHIPDSTNFQTLKNEISEYYPIRLQEAFLFSHDIPGTKNDVMNHKDMYQNEYEEGILYFDPSYQDYKNHFEFVEKSEIYLLNGEYARFTAVITPSEKWTKKGLGEKYGRSRFTIYGDGQKLFSTSVWREDKPVNIDLDVTGVEKLEIAFCGGSDGYFLLANPQLYKKY